MKLEFQFAWLSRLYPAVIVAVTIVRMVQMSVHQIVNVIAMRHGFMAATLAVHMIRRVAGAFMWRATGRVGVAHLDHMLIEMVPVGAVQMAIVQVIGVIAMTHRRVAAALPVHMRMAFVKLMMIPQD